jgi:hypothetical protein
MGMRSLKGSVKRIKIKGTKWERQALCTNHEFLRDEEAKKLYKKYEKALMEIAIKETKLWCKFIDENLNETRPFPRLIFVEVTETEWSIWETI